MTPFPPDAQRAVLAAVVPCAQKFTECRDRAYRCEGCNGDGTRTVITDIEVESGWFRAFESFLGAPVVEFDPDADGDHWREVER